MNIDYNTKKYSKLAFLKRRKIQKSIAKLVKRIPFLKVLLLLSVFCILLASGYKLRERIEFQNPINISIKTQSVYKVVNGNLLTPIEIEKAHAAGQSAEQNQVIEKDPIRAEIREVFGVYADKALSLLQCENPSLDPNAINTAGNYPPGSRDVGLFQINEYWQNVGNIEFLKDPHINIRIAWNIFSRDNYSFKLWTCGRKLGL